MSTFPELLSSLREDFAARYRSPIVAPFLLTFVALHWRIVVHLTMGSNSPEAFIQYVETQLTLGSVAKALAVALAIILVLPWLELGISKVATLGRQKRNAFQFQEEQRELLHRKVIAAREAELIDLELRNARNHSKLQDIEQLRQYQNILSGENLARWVTDLKQEAIHPHLESGIATYVARHDTVEGRYVDKELEAAHKVAVQALSTFGSALAQRRTETTKTPTETLYELGLVAQRAQQAFRTAARERLGV